MELSKCYVSQGGYLMFGGLFVHGYKNYMDKDGLPIFDTMAWPISYYRM